MTAGEKEEYATELGYDSWEVMNNEIGMGSDWFLPTGGETTKDVTPDGRLIHVANFIGFQDGHRVYVDTLTLSVREGKYYIDDEEFENKLC
jgi:hypothetical protein